MHLPRLVATPGVEAGRRRYRRPGLRIDVPPRRKPFERRRKQPAPRIVTKGRIGEDYVELAALGLQIRARIACECLDRPRAELRRRRLQRIDEDPALVTPFAERQLLVGKPEWDALEKRYA